MKLLSELKKERSLSIKPEEIDFGYCIPDCGACCPRTTWMTWLWAREIADELDVDEDNIMSEFNPNITGNDQCPFIYSHSLCLVHDSKLRHPACGDFQCDVYKKIMRLDSVDFNISGKLKQMWLEQLVNGYNQDIWLSTAKDLINRSYEKMFEKKF